MENPDDKIIVEPELIDFSENQEEDNDDTLSIADADENTDIDLIVNEPEEQIQPTAEEQTKQTQPTAEKQKEQTQVEKNTEEQMADHGPVKTIINELTSEPESAPNKYAKTRRPRKSRALTMKDSMQVLQERQKPQVRRTQRQNPNKNLIRKSRYRKRNDDLISF